MDRDLRLIHVRVKTWFPLQIQGYPRLLSDSTLCFGAKEVESLLGRKLNGHFQGEVVSDLSSFACRRVGG